jgi:hypothetical protein
MVPCHTYNNNELFSEVWIQFKSNTNDGEAAAELGRAKNDWGQLKVGVHFKNMYPVITML